MCNPYPSTPPFTDKAAMDDFFEEHLMSLIHVTDAGGLYGDL